MITVPTDRSDAAADSSSQVAAGTVKVPAKAVVSVLSTSTMGCSIGGGAGGGVETGARGTGGGFGDSGGVRGGAGGTLSEETGQ